MVCSFLVAKNEVVMTTLISSHVKNKSCIFSGYEVFFSGKILVIHHYLYNKEIYYIDAGEIPGFLLLLKKSYLHSAQ